MLLIEIHNIKNVTFDGRDRYMVSLLDARGRLLFVPATGKYDPEATSIHKSLEEAITAARDLAQRRDAKSISLRKDGNIFEKVPL